MRPIFILSRLSTRRSCACVSTASLWEYVTLQKSLHASLIARIKILGEMDIAERKGFRRTAISACAWRRVYQHPCVGDPYGIRGKAVLRLWSSNAHIDYPSTFGMEEPDYLKLKRMLQSPNGIIYFTGPTGSGKTTTPLYDPGGTVEEGG